VFTVCPSLSSEPGGYGDETKCAEASQHEDEDRDKFVLSRIAGADQSSANEARKLPTCIKTTNEIPEQSHGDDHEDKR
jgi:hypothetical protein